MAILNPRIHHTAIDGGAFQNEIQERNIMGVPAVFMNGAAFGQGRMTLSEIVNKIDTGAEQRAAQALNQRELYDVLIIGSGPAGAAAAVYSARKGIRTGLLGERFGGQVLDTVDIENYISVPKTEGAILATSLKAHVDEYDVDVIDVQSASRLIPATAPGEPHQIETAFGARLKARSLIIATGARWRNMNVPGEELHVTLLEFAPAMRADAVLQAKLRSLPNVTICLNAQTLEVEGDGSKLTGLRYKDRVSDAEHRLSVAGIFVQIGLLPNTQWLEGTVERNQTGEILIDARCETSVKGIYAAGDCTCVPYKQIIIAAGEGAKASLSAFDYLIRNTPVV